MDAFLHKAFLSRRCRQASSTLAQQPQVDFHIRVDHTHLSAQALTAARTMIGTSESSASPAKRNSEARLATVRKESMTVAGVHQLELRTGPIRFCHGRRVHQNDHRTNESSSQLISVESHPDQARYDWPRQSTHGRIPPLREVDLKTASPDSVEPRAIDSCKLLSCKHVYIMKAFCGRG